MPSCQHSAGAQSLPVPGGQYCRSLHCTQVFPQLSPAVSLSFASIIPTGSQSRFLSSSCPFLISHCWYLEPAVFSIKRRVPAVIVLGCEDSPGWGLSTLPLVRNVSKWPSGAPHTEEQAPSPLSSLTISSKSPRAALMSLDGCQFNHHWISPPLLEIQY